MCFIENSGSKYAVHWIDDRHRQRFIDHIEEGGDVQEWVVENANYLSRREVGVLHAMKELAPTNADARRREAAELEQANIEFREFIAKHKVHEEEVVLVGSAAHEYWQPEPFRGWRSDPPHGRKSEAPQERKLTHEFEATRQPVRKVSPRHPAPSVREQRKREVDWLNTKIRFQNGQRR